MDEEYAQHRALRELHCLKHHPAFEQNQAYLQELKQELIKRLYL